MSFFRQRNLYLSIKRYISNILETTSLREASSLIIAAQKDVHPENDQKKEFTCDYNLLMVKRSGSSSFFANAYVFPGGQIDVSDFSSNWWNLFNQLKVTKEMLSEFSSCKGIRPPIITSPLMLKTKHNELIDPLPSDVAFRIAAIRETFEETGVLLLVDPTQQRTSKKLQNTNIQLDLWQKNISENPSNFIALCKKLNMCPDIWSLFEWSNWVTPTSASKRFDTLFYICCLPYRPKTSIDNSEVTVKRWCSPEEMLHESFSRKNLFLPPPQIYELSRLLVLKSYGELENFSRQRQIHGTEQWLPYYNDSNERLALLPGDDLFSDVESRSDHNADDVRQSIKRFNRFEFKNQQLVITCNIADHGHVMPINYPTSKL